MTARHRRRSFISIVLAIVIATVPASPATRPLPISDVIVRSNLIPALLDATVYP